MSSRRRLATRSVSVNSVPNCSLNVSEDVAQAVQLGLAVVAAASVGTGSISRVRVRERDLHRRLLLDAVAVHVDRFEDALGEVLLLAARAAWGSAG